MACIAVLTAITVPCGAWGYEFELKASTIGQGNHLQSLRLDSPYTRSTRRRLSQTLQLHVWDILGTNSGRSMFDPIPASGPHIFFSSYLRVDHDDGSFTSGTFLLGGRYRDVVDAIPELERSSLQLDALYGYFGAEGLLGGKLDVYAGRMMEVQTLDWFHFDGVKLRVHSKHGFLVEGLAGLRVRQSSWLGGDTLEPDGTSGGLCHEYVEGTVAGSGSWRPIDGLPLSMRSPFTSDDAYCPQREERMPTFGMAIELVGLGWVQGRLSYRRTQSQPPGVIGRVDRLDNPDVGFYPNEDSPVPKWGVNEERIALTLRGDAIPLGVGQLQPYSAIRYSLLHGLVDEAHLGMEYRRNAHRLRSEVFYSVPTFDGDSIFNIFSTEPYSDLRGTWEVQPYEWAHGYLRAWGRRYHSEDRDRGEDPYEFSANLYAKGLDIGVEARPDRARRLRWEAFASNGYGGTRVGTSLWGRWQWRPSTRFDVNTSVIRYAQQVGKHAVNVGTQVGTTYEFNEGVATTLRLEQNSHRFSRFQLGVFAFVNLAFQPET